MSRIVLFNKPYGVLSQFTAEGRHRGLADFIDQPGYYAAGRLDANSEGLLILTDDGRLQARISSPQFKLWKTYWVQVEGKVEDSAVKMLASGVQLKDGMTLPAQCHIMNAPTIWDRTPPVRHRARIPTSWLELSIREGRNRQIRHMTAAAGFPTLRLIRTRIGDWRIDGLAPGEWKFFDLNPGRENSF